MSFRDGIPCRFFPSGSCQKGAKCKFIHLSNDQLSALRSHASSSLKEKLAKTKYPCRFFMGKGCINGKDCKFSHDASLKNTSTTEVPEEEDNCTICMEKPSMYGLLLNCNHSFCLDCVRKWRKSKKTVDNLDLAMKTSLLCPVCRASSQYVIPSIVGFPKGGEGKSKTIELYRERLASTNCKYFMNSSARQRFCPFGDECFYKHPAADGIERYSFGPFFHQKLLLRRERRRLISSLTDQNDGLLITELGAILAQQGEWEHSEYEEEYYGHDFTSTFNGADLDDLDYMFSNLSANEWLDNRIENRYMEEYPDDLSDDSILC
ncbi:RING-type E3 ubiquitin transferase [Entomophthora muscae]|uniref:RING-type E3 ubiquitin transferase n=1 Tax=Entomophthora muscae TaxID=34485 RepID=A0ACC2SMC2_9FUNG|nr:RING-type E3 ubiquitin transferase [Entomophthora muscae]